MELAPLQATDTVWMLAPASGLQTASQIADVVIAALVLLVLAALFVALLQVLKALRALRSVVDRLEPQSHAVLERARGVTENVEAITRSLKDDVGSLTGSVEALTARLHQASDRMEERIEDFNALMEVVQEEAEDIFVGTASTVRGLRSGAAALTPASPPPPVLRPDPSALELPEDE